MSALPKIAVALILCASTRSFAAEREGGRASAPHHVTVFAPETPCGDPVRHEASVSEARPQLAARAAVRTGTLARMPLAAPDVNVENGTARVDLRLASAPRTSIRALPQCEQVAVLASLRATLRADPAWRIDRVVFTERGNLLAF